jgi:hypothetical protein
MAVLENQKLVKLEEKLVIFHVGNSLIDIKKKIMRLKSLRSTNFVNKGRYSLFHIQNSIKKKKRKKKGFDII